jgi:hypothetical protein
MMRESLNRILRSPLQWLQAQLPISLGGVCLKSAEDYSVAVFALSKLSSQDLKRRVLLTYVCSLTGPQSPEGNQLCKLKRLTAQSTLPTYTGVQSDMARLQAVFTSAHQSGSSPPSTG